MSVRLQLLGRPAFDGQPLPPGRGTELIAALIDAGDRGLSDSALIDLLWGDELPEHPRKSLQILVSRVRSQVGDIVVRSGPGYRCGLPPDEIDVPAATAAAHSATSALRAGDPATAVTHARRVLELWRQADTSGAGEGVLADLVTDRVIDHQRAQRVLGIATARLGDHTAAAPALAAAAATDPWDQEVRVEIIRGIAAGAGTAAALDHLEEFRRKLREELGLDPDAALSLLQTTLLRADQPTTRTGVRHPTSGLLGRDDDVRELLALLGHRRLVSVVGPGGLGKTTLAHLVGSAVDASTVVFVPLAGVSGPAATITEISTVLGVWEARPAQLSGLRAGPQGAVPRAVAALGPSAVLILDNCEHLLDDAAATVTDLLAASADLRILVTSRAPLQLPGETVHLLPELDRATSVELFTRRAVDAGHPVLDWTELEHAAVHRLCARLDGLPLAIELAAARTRVLSVEQIDRRLDDRFTLLRGGSRTAPERHRTLEAVIDWSWQLLDSHQQQAVRILSGFADGIGLEAAEAVLRDLLPDSDSLDLIEQLVAQSMVVGPGRRESSRLRILETVREFALSRTETLPLVDVRAAIVRWAATGCDRAAQLYGPEPFVIIDWVREEQDNLVAALRWAVEADDVGAVQRIFLALSSLWLIESAYTRAGSFTDPVFEVVRRALPDLRDLDDEDERRLRAVLMMVALSSMLSPGRTGVRATVALRRRPAPAVADQLDALSIVLARSGEFRRFEGTEADLALAGGNPYVVTAAALLAGQWWENLGDLQRTLQVSELAVRIMPQNASPWLAAMARARLGEVLMQTGRFTEAALHLRQARPVLARIGAWGDVWQSTFGIALGHLHAGELELAQAVMFDETAHLGDELGVLQPLVTATRAELLLAQGDVAGGLAQWRLSTHEALVREDQIGESGLEPWTLSMEALCVIAHLRHDARSDITALADELCHKLFRIIDQPPKVGAAPLFGGLDIPVTGAVTRAVGLWLLPLDPDRAVRLLALAERLSPSRTWPQLSPERAEQDARATADALFDEARRASADFSPEQAVEAVRAMLPADWAPAGSIVTEPANTSAAQDVRQS
ncbi:MAG: BTAD domain-containing putative transcriptional regulator [Nakamurella sp.]